MFADDTILFCLSEDVNALFQAFLFLIVKKELQITNQCFIANKLSLNLTKKYSFFHKPTKNNNISMVLLKLNINNHETERTEFLFDFLYQFSTL